MQPTSPARRHSGKLFFSVFIAFLVPLAMVTTALGIGYGYSITQARKDLEDSQVIILNRVQTEIDIRLENIKNITTFLSGHPLTKAVSQITDSEPWDQYTYVELKETMAEQDNLMQGQGEAAIYFQLSDSVLASRRFSSENLDAYTSQFGLTAQEFRQFCALPTAKGTYKILHPNTSEAILVYLEPILDGEFHQVGTAMTYLSVEFLDNSLDFEDWMEGSVCYMVNTVDSLYIGGSSTRLGEDVLAQQVISSGSVSQDANPTVVLVNGEKYITVSLPSSDSSWQYYFSIPLDTFYQKHSAYILLFIGAVLISILLGLGLSWFFAYRLYQPVNGILSQFNLNMEQAFPKAISAVERALRTYQDNLQAAQSMLKGVSRHRRGDFLLSLCRGGLSTEQIQQGLAEYQLSLSDNPVRLLLFTFHNMENSVFCRNGLVESEMMLYASCNVIEELLCPENGAVFSHDGRIYCVYQGLNQDGGRTQLENDLSQIYQFHKDALGLRLHILASRQGECLSDLAELYLETDELQQFKAFWENDVEDILYYEDIGTENQDDSDYSSLDDEKRFINLLAIKDYEEAHRILKDQLDVSTSRDPSHLRRERYKLYGFISNLVESIPLPAGENPGQSEKLRASVDELLTVKTVDSLRQKVDALFQDIIAYYREKRGQQDTVPWVQEVRDYIEEHYADPQLDVSYLAETFHLNVSHLSRTYKKYTSIGVLDNIHMVRIAKAKELLSQGISVQETSSQVGYQESRALIRAFKRYEGITPGQYQETRVQQ